MGAFRNKLSSSFDDGRFLNFPANHGAGDIACWAHRAARLACDVNRNDSFELKESCQIAAARYTVAARPYALAVFGWCDSGRFTDGKFALGVDHVYACSGDVDAIFALSSNSNCSSHSQALLFNQRARHQIQGNDSSQRTNGYVARGVVGQTVETGYSQVGNSPRSRRTLQRSPRSLVTFHLG